MRRIQIHVLGSMIIHQVTGFVYGFNTYEPASLITSLTSSWNPLGTELLQM
ncbi:MULTISPECIES: hypothetical protein [Brevibacillus]|uniref:hypothetical protein n=1 Tax=Brevibacillus TaxID=55080 RepID=UPI00203D2816|nr:MULTISPECIES: hypothetical protein [Brevibacillus]MCM3080657.1 hypothetical protein [Brevibacillus invocatus]MCM3431238.1 hypothetical protein [Brevibacillus invocatus]MDH4619352.1 hypothetical protein [Brevibacillus sp. AY1]